VTFVRRAGKEAALVAINFSNRPFAGWVEVTKFLDRDNRTTRLAMSLEAWDWRILNHD
jgi:hypothetical protein